MTQAQLSRKNTVLLVIALLILLVVAALMTDTSKNKSTKEHVVVKSPDMQGGGDNSQKIPEGFPVFIPLETEDIVESYSMNYPDRKITQHTVNYRSSKTQDQKYKEYLDFMTKNGFTFGPEGKNTKTGTLYAAKNGNDLLVVTTQVGQKTLVQIAYIDRQ